METTQFNNQLSKSHIEIFQGSLEQNENSSDDRFAYKIINIVALGVLTNKGEPLKIDFERLGETLDVKKIKRFPSVQFKVNNKSLSLFKNGKIIFKICLLCSIRRKNILFYCLVYNFYTPITLNRRKESDSSSNKNTKNAVKSIFSVEHNNYY